MKRLLIVSILLLSLIGLYAQDRTKKWNDIYKRYEYYDSRGNLTGYEKWNSIYNRWEYFDNNSSRGRKYEYKSPYNTELMERVLTIKNAQAERILNQRISVIEEVINEILDVAYEKYKEGRISEKGFNQFTEDLKEMMNITNGEVLHNYSNLLDRFYGMKRRALSW